MNARDKCEKFGAHLANVRSDVENDFLSGFMFETWIGARKENDHWTDGSELEFSYWRSKVLENITQDCGILQRHHGGKWSNVECKTLANFTCKKGSVSVSVIERIKTINI